MNQIINSPLDTDAYKFTMQGGVLLKFPEVMVKYRFKERNREPLGLGRIQSEIEDEIHNLSKLRFTCDDISYLRKSMPYLPKAYLDILKYYKFDTSGVDVRFDTDNSDRLKITIEGSWFNTILFEVPVLAIVSECRTKYLLNEHERADALHELFVRNANKLDYINEIYNEFPNFTYIDFGTRRRFDHTTHEEIVRQHKECCPNSFVGTSNVRLSDYINTNPKGTQAHEWFMVMQSLKNRCSIESSNRYGLQSWADVYRGDLGIALSDTLGFNYFLKDFDKYFAKLFDGCRHDSGDPMVWCDKLINHYHSLGIDPTTKTAIFSDGLNFHKARTIYERYKDKINVSFGIGTHLTNDVGNGIEAPKIVIKVVEAQGQPVAKISDSEGKQMCEDEEYVERVKTIIEKN